MLTSCKQESCVSRFSETSRLVISQMPACALHATEPGHTLQSCPACDSRMPVPVHIRSTSDRCTLLALMQQEELAHITGRDVWGGGPPAGC